MPRDLDLRGGDVSDARRAWQQILFDHPGFELEAGALTLPEIQERAASFDPLTLELNVEVRAISGNAWFSLGRHGLGLHFEPQRGQSSEFLVLKRAERGKKWEVSLDGRVMARFSNLEEAVQAVDYEIEQRGRLTAASALPDADWRRERVSQAEADSATRADALRFATFRRIVAR